MRCSKSNAKGEFDSNINLPQETRKALNKQSNLTPKATRKRRTKKTKINRMKEIIRIREKISEKEMKETTEQINKT